MFLPCGMVGPWQIIVILLIVVLLFGGSKIPELMRGVGRGVKEFKDAVNKDYTADNTKKVEEPKKSSDQE
jgi:sec-independent protein translocase protein TatA